MSNYILSAKLYGKTSVIPINEDTDGEAIWASIFQVLDNAKTQRLWAKGRIELRDMNGRVLKVMEAKV